MTAHVSRIRRFTNAPVSVSNKQAENRLLRPIALCRRRSGTTRLASYSRRHVSAVSLSDWRAIAMQSCDLDQTRRRSAAMRCGHNATDAAYATASPVSPASPAATSAMPPTDKLLVRGVRLFGRHGVHSAEKSLGQLFRVDVDVHADVRRACRTDDFRHTLDYVHVYDIVKRVVQGPPRNLVEAVAEDIAAAVLSDLPLAHAVRVSVQKPHVAIPAVLDAVGVEIWRERERHLS